jgi:hypothetical protein
VALADPAWAGSAAGQQGGSQQRQYLAASEVETGLIHILFLGCRWRNAAA